MSGAVHTPGPWEADQEYGLDAVFDSNGKPVALLFEVGFGRGSKRLQGDLSAANARLIAAAPELLETLVAVVGQADARDGVVSRKNLAVARAAIMKALGAQPTNEVDNHEPLGRESELRPGFYEDDME